MHLRGSQLYGVKDMRFKVVGVECLGGRNYGAITLFSRHFARRNVFARSLRNNVQHRSQNAVRSVVPSASIRCRLWSNAASHRAIKLRTVQCRNAKNSGRRNVFARAFHDTFSRRKVSYYDVSDF